MGTLYFGDNLDILREYIQDETIDLIYLDPPFNSKRGYNLLFKTPKGHSSDAQVSAFEDTWHWGEQTEREFNELLHQPNTNVSETVQAFRRFLDQSDMMAYLVMMTNRLLELHRVLRPTGSLYLHCDPTASHYLKVILDTVFGGENFQNEIIWKRTSAHSDTKQGNVVHMGRIHDVVLFYSKSEKSIRNELYQPYSEAYIINFYRHVDKDGRRYRLGDLTGPGGASKGNPKYEFLGVTRYWRYKKERMEELYKEGRIIQTKPGAVPQYKRYLDEMPGTPLQDLWDDISPIGAQAIERLGYPTQKPLALLERIIQASSNPGDLVLDPFCGCGTAIHAAQKLGRAWIGIDITHLAINLIEQRMKTAFPDITFEVFGSPKDLASARELAQRNKYEFQWWACSLVNAQPYQGKKKGADSGIDGLIYFQDDEVGTKSEGAKKIIVSVKGGENVGVGMVKDLIATVEREKAAIGLLVTLAEPTRPMITEALSAGYYASPKGDFQKIQILTIEDLLSGKAKPQYNDISSGTHTHLKAKVEQRKAKQNKLF